MPPQNHAIVWIDIPVSNLARSISFYQATLSFDLVSTSKDPASATLMLHGAANGITLIEVPSHTPSANCIVPYFNCEGRLKQAVSKAKLEGGELVQSTHSMEPYGFRAVLKDADGNRFAVHSNHL